MIKVSSLGHISISVHQDAQDWSPSPGTIHKLNNLMHKPVRVKIYPRYLIKKVYDAEHPGKDLCLQSCYYKFRAYAGKDYCTIFVDETETPDSVMWVLLHELAHIELTSSSYLFKGYRFLTSPDYFESDEAHESDPEEQMANKMADAWMEMLGYGKVSYPRPWWRERTIMASGQNKTASGLVGAGIGGTLAGASGFNKALSERRQDQLLYMQGKLNRKQMGVRDSYRLRDLGIRTGIGAGIGFGAGRAVRSATGRTKQFVKQKMKEGEEAGQRLISQAEGSGKSTVDRLAEGTAQRYEETGKRIAEHSAAEHSKRFAERSEAGRKKLPRWLGGDRGWFGGNLGAKTASFHFFSRELRGI